MRLRYLALFVPLFGLVAAHIGFADGSRSQVFHGDQINKALEQKNDPYWRRALEETYKSPDELVAQDARERRRGRPLNKILRGDPTKPAIALTFDDGPHPELTLQLLDILKEEKVKATFFVIGKMVEQHPELLKAIEAGGHTIGNHTFSHVTLTKIPLKDILTEYQANNDLIKQIIHKDVRFCRPPGGDYDPLVIQGATDCGLTTVLWTDDPGDYANPGSNVIEERTLARLSNGGIILLHDGVKETLEVLPQIIRYAKQKGFRFVTLDEMARDRS